MSRPLAQFCKSCQIADCQDIACRLQIGASEIEIEEEAILTEEEKKRIEKSRNSGIHTDISKLKEYIKSQL